MEVSWFKEPGISLREEAERANAIGGGRPASVRRTAALFWEGWRDCALAEQCQGERGEAGSTGELGASQAGVLGVLRAPGEVVAADVQVGKARERAQLSWQRPCTSETAQENSGGDSIQIRCHTKEAKAV